MGGSNENEAGNGFSVQNCNVFEDQSYDADSSNVLHTRMVVDSEETGSPTFLCTDWNWEADEGDLSNGIYDVVFVGNIWQEALLVLNIKLIELAHHETIDSNRFQQCS